MVCGFVTHPCILRIFPFLPFVRSLIILSPTIVLKLLNLTKATRAYFGKKDAQQLFLIQDMVKRFFLNIDIVACDIVRDSNGLALSSRNLYLSEKEKKKALCLSKSLKRATRLIIEGERDCMILKSRMLEILSPLSVEYVEIVDRKFNLIDKIQIDNTIILVAAFAGKTRLIDNMWV